MGLGLPIIIFLTLLTSLAALARLLLILGNFLNCKKILDLEKFSPFECGFAPLQESRSLFSIHFFLLAMVFLIFDIELVLLFPMLFEGLQYASLAPLVGVLFVFILSFGAFIE